MRGFFGIGIWHPKTSVNVGTLWRSAHNFGAAFLYTVGHRYDGQPSDTTKASRHVPLLAFSTIDDLVAHLPHGCPLVGVELDARAWPLPRVVHPERACYLLGAEDHGLPDAVRTRCHLLVQVPGASRCLNVATAGSIVLYDRIMKDRREGPAAGEG